MKVSELIEKLQEMQDQVGDVEVQTYSVDYCCSLHKIEDVTDGWYDGWRDHDNVIGICITSN